MQFSRELRDDVAAGAITLTVRLWQRPQVKEGGRYAVGNGEIEIDSVELVPFSAITDDDVRRAGEPDRETLRQRAAHAGPIEDDTLVHRIEFHATVVAPVGLRYLELITTLLQRRRLANPTGEVWEAADLQWWWPRHRHEDPDDARVWLEDGEPVAAVVITRWSADRHGCEVLADPGFEPAWAFAAERCARADAPRIEMALPPDAIATHAAARRAGFVSSDESYGVAWMAPEERRPPRRPLPEGYRIITRADEPSRSHWMVSRNGVDVEGGLRQCSLYRPELDFAVLAPDHEVAGYVLVWADPVTGVGMVEPMRVEAEHGGQGLGAQLLDAGLRGLSDAGCSRLKVSFEPSNEAARRLYTGGGFVVSGFDPTWLFRARN